MTAVRRTLVRIAIVATLGAASLGCPHEDQFDGAVYHNGRLSFRAGPIPSTWQRLKMDGPLLAFHDTTSNGSVDVYAKCGEDRLDTSLLALRTQLLIGFTETNFREEKVVPFDDREALRTVIDAKLDGVPMSLDIYVYKKNGCVYDLVYVARPQRFDSGVQSFESFVAGFSALGG